ncbi:glyoxalase [Rhizobium altiplani]|uniref:Glyoxalase n=1 Tax=Rhizobium altiplani TaxID=1864509 RepID=A0A109J6N1_9HYPH|nr:MULTISPECIES: VOC family protein [Rhizobium]KWV43331.1 glyoxalase [Rhizobium altiplani]MDQ0561126.1 catechol 2,3-dioxygenase-like lactoylglutathione lyase family enzyme [Rhizobium mesoamericanum]
MSVSGRRIDHIVLAVHDLEAAARFYERLGFRLGARNRHPWGTDNRLVQFGSSFIELIAIGDDPGMIPPHAPGRFSFGGFLRDYLQAREGFAMFVLDSADAKADAAAFLKKGIGDFEPVFFERKGRRPDGGETHVAFTLAFAMDPNIPNASFFVCQQHFPENFWNAEFQNHPNGATNVVAVTLTTEDPDKHAGFLADFTGVSATQDRNRTGYALLGGRLNVEKSDEDGGFTGYTIAIPDLTRQRQLLSTAGVPFTAEGNRITIKPEDAFGVAIGFVSGG